MTLNMSLLQAAQLPQTTGDDDDNDDQVYLDESDDIGDIEAGMSVQDIDEVEEIKEEA